MQSFRNEPLTQEQINQLKILLNCDDLRVLKKAGGGNSKVFCIETVGMDPADKPRDDKIQDNNRKKWAVKFYPPYALNQRDRLASELMVYQFLNQHHIDTVPEVKAYSTRERFLVMDWIEGSLPQDITHADICEALRFIQQIALLNSSYAAKNLPYAAEAFTSLDILIEQITKRLQRLYDVADQEPTLNRFLVDEFSPAFERCKQNAYQGYEESGIDPHAELSDLNRSLIPADFGFHNAIRLPKGQLYFFDFDYFGWDDPVKLLADILWHPKMNLSTAYEQQFIEGIAEIYSGDHLFLNRFRYTLPLFGLRWVLILLNEFIPAVWQNRQHAEVHSNEVEAKQKQLDHAKALLQTVKQRNKAVPAG